MHHVVSRLAVTCVLALAPAVSADAAECPRSQGSPAAMGTGAAARTTLCLLNRERDARGLRPLRQDPRLTRAARGHARDMVAHGYFAHRSRSGASVTTRIRRTGWMRSRRSWIVGENIGHGSGGLAAPEAVLAGWMRSHDHRANILAREFRLIGIGVALGTPDGEAGATYTADFGG